MATPSTIIINALINANLKIIGDTLSTAEQTHYLAKLNQFLESESLNRENCYQMVEENFSLASSTGSYTIGSGGSFNTSRPAEIIDPCFIRDSSGTDYPLTILNRQAYDNIQVKTVDGSISGYLFYDKAWVNGLGTIYLYPEPSSGLTLYINSWKALQSFPLISTVVSLPPGYLRYIESNFAIECAAGVVPVSQELIKIARDSKAAIERVNAPTGIARIDPGVTGRNYGRWDIRAG